MMSYGGVAIGWWARGRVIGSCLHGKSRYGATRLCGPAGRDNCRVGARGAARPAGAPAGAPPGGQPAQPGGETDRLTGLDGTGRFLRTLSAFPMAQEAVTGRCRRTAVDVDPCRLLVPLSE